MRRYLLMFALMAVVVSQGFADAEPVRKKLIEAGDQVTPQQLARDVSVMDKGCLVGRYLRSQRLTRTRAWAVCHLEMRSQPSRGKESGLPSLSATFSLSIPKSSPTTLLI